MIGGGAPVETKVTASTVAATLTAALCWVLATYVWPDTGVPEPILALLSVAVTGGVTFAAGYLARHTSRPALDEARHRAT